MKYFQKNAQHFLICLLICLAYNLYFLFLIPHINNHYLFYLDFLLMISFLFFIIIDFMKYKKREKEKEKLLSVSDIIYQEYGDFENQDIMSHDMHIMENQIQQQIEINHDLQDYMTKWCHEMKIPLSACLLMNEKIENSELRMNMKEQLERMKQDLNTVMVGCKVQSSVYDIQVHSVDLLDCVKSSIHNNQFFLIHHRFTIDIHVEQRMIYTDKEWLIYVFDQLIHNAIKYAKEKPFLKIWSELKDDSTCLYIEDHGEGIQDIDIRRIFEKGYTGSNHHNGRYKSTGMGLYMVSMIIRKLGHEIYVESQYHQYTRFTIVFKDNRDYFI